MPDFLLELRSEEIPARMQAGARAELERLFRREMDAAGVAVGPLATYSTPRRLALVARDLPDATQAVSEEAKGPPEGAPDAAVDGFCRKNGVTRDRLQLREVKGRATWFAVIERPGRAVGDVLAEAIPAIVRDFSWPKSMRWGAASIGTESLRWVRPLSGIVAILGEELVPCEIGGVRSGYATVGHRFHSAKPARPEPVERRTGSTAALRQAQDERSVEGAITIGGAHDYLEKLRACHVIVDHEERALLIREGARGVAKKAGLSLIEDEGLVIENAGLTEWPIPLLGWFDEAFLDVPPEVIQLTARVNQKYFVCYPPRNGEGDHAKHGGGASAASATARGSTMPPAPLHQPSAAPPPPVGEDRLANAFICTANIEAADGGAAIVEGNRKVLAARLADARFFWEQDRRKTLAEHAEDLQRITFHEKLGTVADKVERVAKLARWLVEEGIVPPRNGEGDHAQHGGGAGAGSELLQGSATPPVPLHQPSAGPPPPPGEERAQLATLAEQAARLCKADLVTEMVGEFPELQGVMGGYYARAEGLPDAVADAIRDHYKPVGQGDEVPTAPVTVAVSLADKLDTLTSFFGIDERPTGSKDPFALRRAALGLIRLLTANNLRLQLNTVRPELVEGPFFFLKEQDSASTGSARTERKAELLDFLADRLKVQQREAGVRHDLIDAVFSLGNEDDLVRLLARVNALQSYIETPDGQNLLAAYKRAANILKKEDWPASPPPQAGGALLTSPLPQAGGVGGGPDTETQGIARTGEEDPLALVDDPDLKAVVDAKLRQQRENSLSYTPEPAEKALIEALDFAEPRARAAIAAEDFTGAMQALALLRAPIDAFFDTVTVNDPDGDKRAARLDLLARFRDAVGQVADFGRIEG